MKNMNKRESKKIAVMAAIIVGLMMFAFTPLASAEVTSFSVTPVKGVAGAIDSYNALVTTEGVSTINVTIPAGFIAVKPMSGGVQIARVDFWNESTKAYYGYATITSNNTHPTPKVDVYCKFQVDGDELVMSTTQAMNYGMGDTTTFKSGFPSDTSEVKIKLPTETQEGSINITIDCTPFKLDDVSIDIGQFVRNPTTAGDYTFNADGVDGIVHLIAAGGCGAVFRGGLWYLDTNGDHMTDISFLYGATSDKALVGDVDRDGRNDDAVFRGDGVWYVDTTGNHNTNMCFVYGKFGDQPIVGDIDQLGFDDTAVFRAGIWYVDTDDDHITNMCFLYGKAGDNPVVGDFDRNGVDDTAVFRAGTWYVDINGDHITDLCFLYGKVGDQPMVGDINLDGFDDIAVLRGGTWFVDTDDDHITDLCYVYGAPEDKTIGGYFR